MYGVGGVGDSVQHTMISKFFYISKCWKKSHGYQIMFYLTAWSSTVLGKLCLLEVINLGRYFHTRKKEMTTTLCVWVYSTPNTFKNITLILNYSVKYLLVQFYDVYVHGVALCGLKVYAAHVSWSCVLV